MAANLASMTEAAYDNRRVVGDPIPTDAELDALAERVEDLNEHGSDQNFMDAQANLIDALLVRLDVLRLADQHDGRSEKP